MIGKFQRQTLKITSIHDFNSQQFLRRLQKSFINAGLTIVVDGRTSLFLSVFDRSYLRKNKSGFRLNIVRSLVDGCSFQDSILPHFPDGRKVLIHVIGLPVVGENQMEELVGKLLDTEIPSWIFVNLSSVSTVGMECPFRVTFSMVISGSSDEALKRNATVAASLIRAIYDNNSIQLIINRNVSRSLKKLIAGGHIYSTVLDAEHASAYFQIPLTYGIESEKKMGFPIPPSPFDGVAIGVPAEFRIKEIDKIRLDPARLYEHMAVWGASGTGKTTFLKNLLLNLDQIGVKFCVMDWHNEYRNIASRLRGKLGNEILILNPFLNSIAINPLELPDSSTTREVLVWERIENFISLIKQMFILGEIQEARIRESLSNLYQQSSAPIIGEAISAISNKKVSTLTMKLKKFTTGFYGRIFNCRHSSISFSDLRKKNVIIELGQLPSEVRKFFACTFLILWWDYLRVSSFTPNVMILDDFYRYSSLSVIRKMLSEARKFKQGIICSHQGPCQIPSGAREEVVRNTATKVIFRQEQTSDKHIINDALGNLTNEQIEALSYLDIGQAIVKLPSAKFPVRVNTPLPPETKPMGNWEIKRAMSGFVVEQRPIQEVTMGKSFEVKFLEEIQRRPQVPLTEITKALRIKTSRGYILKGKMVEDGYLLEEKIRSGKGRPKISLKITDKGLEYIGKKGSKTAPQYGKSEHVYIVNKIASSLKGCNIKVEDSCDIKVEKDGKKAAIEVETGKTNERKQIVYNVDRDAKWADKVVIICPNKKIKLDIKELLGSKVKCIDILTYREIDNLPEILFFFPNK